MNIDKRYLLFLDEQLNAGMAINTAAHLAAQFGCRNPNIGGCDVQDRDGNQYNGLPVCPNIILKICRESLQTVVERGWMLQSDHKVQILVYPEAGKLTTTDEEFREMIRNQSRSEIRILGCLVFGAKNVLNRLSKKAKSAELWN